MNCDETQVDCGGTDCMGCCVGCHCINVVLTSGNVSTETDVENRVEITIANNDPSHTVIDTEVYINNSDDLDNCFGRACESWEYYFEDSLGNYIGKEKTSPITVTTSADEKIYFVFIASGPTPMDKYAIDIGVRDVGMVEC